MLYIFTDAFTRITLQYFLFSEIFERLITNAERDDAKAGSGSKKGALSAHQLRSVLNKYVLFEQTHGGLLAEQRVQQLRLRATELLSKLGVKEATS